MNNFVISDIESQRKPYPDSHDPSVSGRFLTLDKYLQLARRIIGQCAPANVRAMMLGSEDAISFVAHHIMVGDWDYDNTRAEVSTRRGYCGRCGIMDYLDAMRRQRATVVREEDGRERKVVTVNNFLDISGDNSEESPRVHEMIPDRTGDSTEQLVAVEEESRIQRAVLRYLDELTPTQRHCVAMYYLKQMRSDAIAESLGICRQAVWKHIKNGMARMQELAREDSYA